MENASKALIIAGAILISILLITIGIFLINSGRDVANSGENAMSSSAIQAFNSQFTKYEGNNKSYNEVNQLLNTVISSNSAYHTKIAIRLRKYNQALPVDNYNVIDSAYFVVKNSRKAVIKSSSDNRKPVGEIKSFFNQHLKNKKFNVYIHYFDEYASAENSLNPTLRIYFFNWYWGNKINKKDNSFIIVFFVCYC